MTLDAKKMQQRLGVAADGAIGRGTLTALFSKMGCPPVRAAEFGMAANVHFRTYLILGSGLRLAHFMAQLAHESDGFKAMQEYASGSAYEGRADLGNTQPGDGVRYKGHGPIQITGRANHRSYGQMLGIDFENHPELLTFPSIGLIAACAFWTTHRLNELADADNILAITKKINGGTNGLGDRQNRFTLAKGLVL